jgi:N-acetylmuramoyl-L-alanine amidase
MKLNDRQTQYANMVVEEARRQGVNPQLALSIAFAESSFNPDIPSSAGAIGIMQLMPCEG